MIRKSAILKTVAILLTIICMCFAITTCTPTENCSTVKHEITFCSDAGIYSKIQVAQGKTIIKPENPQKQNYIFLNWCVDQELNIEYDFSKSVYESFSLYAKFKMDGVAVTNEITTNTIKSIVKITNTSYNTNIIDMTTEYVTGLGSGVVYKIENDWFYILTNCHVAIKKQNFSRLSLTVFDYMGREFDAELISANANYDLAVIRFKQKTNEKEKTDAIALDFALNDPKINDDVIALGSPHGQVNAISYGIATQFKKITLSETSEYYSNVQFDVLQHSAYINNGSSGGPLLNANLEIIGINYAGENNGEKGYSIPVSKVQEFLLSII